MNDLPDETTILAWARLVLAARSVLGAVEADLKAAGFPPLGWYDVALEVRRAGRAMRPVEIEEQLLIPQSNVSRLLDRMVAAGYLSRQPCADDRRGFELNLTLAGHDLLAKMWPTYRDLIQRHVGGKLQPGEAETLAAALGRLLD
ncbi:MarR family transcriptional regulator [Tabrizicola sp.]|uniref:MarR family winged helix-turn-helix transcriptional regulator n=1 Tax=Tabrizicola sp. TaxID=2005166 RepID=UPI00286B58FA|nr:MarR family transcriptional regulator [Tabrizicola sp.]